MQETTFVRWTTWSKMACAVCVLLMMTAISANAQTFTSLFSFDNTDGQDPSEALVQGTNGDFYGTAYSGGANSCDGGTFGCGTVFKITTNGTLTTLYSFCSQVNCADGQGPSAALIQATDGNFYGTTVEGGPNDVGTVFKITPNGTLTTIHSFDLTDGEFPETGLIQATDGNFYGTTVYGGANGSGTVFKITPSGTLTTLYSFCSEFNCTDGAEAAAGLIQATNGNFYGTTIEGGAGNYGTVFKITSSGTLTTLYSFCSKSGCTDGANPVAALVQATDGSLFGTTVLGGTNGFGTVFKITTSGALKTLYSFCSQSGCPDGTAPYAKLIQATDRNFYGTTSVGGTGDGGTVFKITPGGMLTTLYSFCQQTNCTDGADAGGLAQDTNGSFYGTTSGGGVNGDGTVFSLSVGLGRFVGLLPAAAAVGQQIGILGTNLTGATSVTFNGTTATFTVDSPSLISTTVPAGATTGKVDVTTPSGTLTSNVVFRVKP